MHGVRVSAKGNAFSLYNVHLLRHWRFVCFYSTSFYLEPIWNFFFLYKQTHMCNIFIHTRQKMSSFFHHQLEDSGIPIWHIRPMAYGIQIEFRTIRKLWGSASVYRIIWAQTQTHPFKNSYTLETAQFKSSCKWKQGKLLTILYVFPHFLFTFFYWPHCQVNFRDSINIIFFVKR